MSDIYNLTSETSQLNNKKAACDLAVKESYNIMMRDLSFWIDWLISNIEDTSKQCLQMWFLYYRQVVLSFEQGEENSSLSYS